MTLFLCTTLTIATSCNHSTNSEVEPLEKAAANVEDTGIHLKLTLKDSVEYINYKTQAGIKLRGNELLIADMKDRLNTEPKEVRMNYKTQLDSLDLRNSKLKNTMHKYSTEGKGNWELFKKNFDRDLDALSKSISRIAERNTKKV